jgi:hypothetical protein
MKKPTLDEFFKQKNLRAEDFMQMPEDERQIIREQFATAWGLPVEVMFGMAAETKLKETT